MMVLITVLALSLVAGVFKGMAGASRNLSWRDRFTLAATGWASEFGELVFDLVDPQELQGFARALQQEIENNQFVLSQFLPNDNIDDIEYRITTGQLNQPDAAKVRAWDTESPIGKRQGLSRLMGELPPISKKIPVTEELRLRRRALERGNNQEIVNAIFDDAANMVRSVTSRVEMMRGEALYSGKIIINENGVQQTVDFGRAATHSPAALAGVAMWSATATATPLTDVRGWVATYRATNGVAPAFILTSPEVIANLLLNAQLRDLATRNGNNPAFLSNVELNQIFAAYGLPPFVEYDVQVRVDGVATRVIPSDRVILMPPAGAGLGASLFGTTVESLELVDAQQLAADQAPGLVVVNDKTWDPVITWTKAVAIALPILANPNLTLAVDVQ